MKFKFFASLFLVCCVSGNALSFSDDQRPDYQKEYDAYLQDLQFIEQKGYAPENPILKDDLAKMNSEKRIRLTHPSARSYGARSSEQSDVDRLLKIAENDSDQMRSSKNDAEVIDRVEIIRVPEEFREKYANVYAEETKRISAQNLVKQQEENRQKALEDEEALKIAEHNNPFRLLKEKELETVVPETKRNSERDSVTEAYFKQQKRAFVAGKPIVIEKKEIKKAKNEAEDTIVREVSESEVSVQNESASNHRSKSRVHRTGSNENRSSPSFFGKGGKTSNMFLE